MRTIILVFFLVIIFSGCEKTPLEVRNALELAKNNKYELEKVLSHYQKPEDSLKLKAAYFLISNMKYKYALTGEKLEKYDTIFNYLKTLRNNGISQGSVRSRTILSKTDSLWEQLRKNEGILLKERLLLKPDLLHIDAKYLIENIDYAFKAWELPWSNHLSFEEFCTYILPYRFGNERLEPWRSKIYNSFSKKIDSLIEEDITDPKLVCNLINRELSKVWLYSQTMNNYPVDMSYSSLFNGLIGSCRHQAELGVYVMRSIGIPTVHEQIPHYGNRSVGHDFNSMLQKNGKFVNFEVGNTEIASVIEKREKWGFKIPKVYRQTFEIAHNFEPEKKGEMLSPPFKNPYSLDVSDLYLSVSDLSLDLKFPNYNKSKYAYLCVFDNQNWKAIDTALIDANQKVEFKNVGKGIVYLPMVFTNNTFKPASYPFILHKDGSVSELAPIEKKRKIILDRKYWFKPDISTKPLVNTVIQASNRKDFKNATTLYTIEDTLNYPIPQKINTNTNQPYRYVRFLFPSKSTGNIAEMEFTSETGKRLNGNLISNPELQKNSTLKNVRDQDVATYLKIEKKEKSSNWIGLDFNTKKYIKEISFCPRTDKNNVWPGLSYELFYWDKQWKSLGIKKANSYQLKFESNITQTLFLLKCLDEGKEERIFTYDQALDKQIIW